METHLKKIIIVVGMLSALLLSGCGRSDEIDQKNAEITHLKTELAQQKGNRAADLEFGERQAGMYLGCKQFFNRCSKETRELGEQRLQNGFTGTTSRWYWVGLLGEFTCIALAAAVFVSMLRYLHLVVIAPKREKVEQAQGLINGAKERARSVNRRTNELEKRTGLMKKELAELFATKQMQKKSHPSVEHPDSKPPAPAAVQTVKQADQDY